MADLEVKTRTQTTQTTTQENQTTHMSQFAESIFAIRNKKLNLVDFEVDVKIDGLDVRIDFELNSRRFKYMICTKHHDIVYTYNQIREDGDEITPRIIEQYINTLLAELRQMTFSVRLGYFTTPSSQMPLLKYNVFEEFSRKCEECPICFEKTITLTDCFHVCCYKCQQEISKCPICRSEFQGEGIESDIDDIGDDDDIDVVE